MSKIKVSEFPEYPAFLSYTPYTTMQEGQQVITEYDVDLYAGIPGILEQYTSHVGAIKVKSETEFEAAEQTYPTKEEAIWALYEAWRQPKAKKKGKR